MSSGSTYTASDGSVWHLSCDCPPVPSRVFDWCAVHDDYDGAPDAHDDRYVYGPTKEDAVAAVETWIWDNGCRDCGTVLVWDECPRCDAE